MSTAMAGGCVGQPRLVHAWSKRQAELAKLQQLPEPGDSPSGQRDVDIFRGWGAVRRVALQARLFEPPLHQPATGGNLLDATPVGYTEGPGGPGYNNRSVLSYHVRSYGGCACG